MLNRDFKECVASFNAHGVEYLVVGGYALAAHGRPRYTGDIDLWVRPTGENARRVLAALKAFGFGALAITETDLTTRGNVIQLGYPPRRIDLLTSIDGVEFDACHGRRRKLHMTTRPFRRRSVHCVRRECRTGSRQQTPP